MGCVCVSGPAGQADIWHEAALGLDQIECGTVKGEPSPHTGFLGAKVPLVPGTSPSLHDTIGHRASVGR